MAKSIRKCKVCGKEYEYCKTWLSSDKFRWQDVACSPECGATYFTRVEAVRGVNVNCETDEAKQSQDIRSDDVTESASVETAVEYKAPSASECESGVVKTPKRGRKKTAKALSE